jgi:hypothetical protein
MLWKFISQGNFTLFYENFKLVSQLKLNPFVDRPVTRGKVLTIWLLRMKVEVNRGDYWEKDFVV